MQNYSLSTAPPSGPKNYVFVDEHNRHKRLKVMRACENCRRRKIKCDSATTNTWPCAACVRLKLHCVPPAGGLEGDDGTDPGTVSLDAIEQTTFTQEPIPSVSQSQPYQQNPAFQLNQGDAFQYDPYSSNYQKSPFQLLDKPYGNYYPSPQQFPGALNDPYNQGPQLYQSGQSDVQPVRQERAGSSPSDPVTAEDLMEHLGSLKIGENGVAPYLRQEKTPGKETEVPLQEPEPEPIITAALSTGAGSQIRIPPELMPSHEEAMQAFKTFFRDVHPYAPVLCRSHFYNQWQNDRSSISPLVLEAVLANAGRLSDDPAQGAQWLALANKHEASFLDSPRLSTLQALILLLKARESAPKRGYYYRSWMTCKTAVSMAKDLELDEHFETHSAGEQCGSDPVDCLTKTRVWQTLLVCETMVGGPQGRTDLAVDPNSVEISATPPCSDIDEFEKSISRQFAYFVRNVRNIRLITVVSHKLKKKKDWGLDQEFVAYNTTFRKWPDDLPKDLQIVLPPDGTVPKVSSHFLGNMHSHYHLAIVMLRRPQLSAAQTYSTDGLWKQHMSACYHSAKVLCKLQEGILASFDLTGLLCMQRGINFTIYAILTCIMIHLIAISSPDPDFNTDARGYFVRHMRILERCIAAWPMTETEAQINALRAAFSADVNKPFELRESFPLGSPSDQSGPSPVAHPAPQPQPNMLDLQPQNANAFIPQHLQLNTMRGQTPYLATPPVSAYSATDSKPPTPIYASPYELPEHSHYSSMPTSAGGYYQQPTSVPGPEIQWNPTPIIQQFDTAFAIPPSQLAPPPSLYGGSGSSPPGVSGMGSLNTSFAATNSPPFTNSPPGYNQHQHQQQQHYFAQHAQSFHHDTSSPIAGQPAQLPSSATSSYTIGGGAVNPAMQFVTPRQWQQSVQSVIDPTGLKRRWDYDHH